MSSISKKVGTRTILFYASTLSFATMFNLQSHAQSASYKHVIDIDTIEYPGTKMTALQRLALEQDNDLVFGKVTFLKADLANYGIAKCIYVQNYQDGKLKSLEIKTKGESGYEELLRLFDKITMQTSQVENRSICIERSVLHSDVPLTVSFITDKRHRRNSLIVEMTEN